MPNLDIKCSECGCIAEAFCALSTYVDGTGYPTPPCEKCSGKTEQVFLPNHGHVIDDTLPGGARWMWNLGDEGVWVSTKTQYKQELRSRGLVQAERNNYNKNDKSPWATRTTLRAGQRDPFIHKAER